MYLTDKSTDLLQRNVLLNASEDAGKMVVDELVWGDDGTRVFNKKFDFIFGAVSCSLLLDAMNPTLALWSAI